jgi:protein-L-isoaspartate(D-aspartate) O-methyltransferase
MPESTRYAKLQLRKSDSDYIVETQTRQGPKSKTNPSHGVLPICLPNASVLYWRCWEQGSLATRGNIVMEPKRDGVPNQSPSSADDAYRLRQELVDKLKANELIGTPSVEAAFRGVLRHLFVPIWPIEAVYSDRALPTKVNDDGTWLSSSSQPAIMAIMLEQLGLETGDAVLEIGAGTGYNAALMAHIVGATGRVVTVDIEQDLVTAARENLSAGGFENVAAISADGGYGFPEDAPYDRIILTVGAPDILPAWVEQLKPGGRLVLPLAVTTGQWSIAFERVGDHLVGLSVRACGFMLLRGAFAEAHVPPLRLGPDAGLYVRFADDRPVNAGQIYQWLTGSNVDWETGIQVTAREVFQGLGLWLSMYEPDTCTLVAEGDMVDRDVVPPLLGVGGEWKSASTEVLIGERGLAALMRPPGQPVPLMDINNLFASDSPFRLYVRHFGVDASLAQRLIAQVNAWDAAGRPAFGDLRIRAYLKDADYALAEGELVVEKEWSRIVLAWQTH